MNDDLEDTPQSVLTSDHYVSKGYQKNFGTTDRYLAVVDVASGLATAKRRAIKVNFQERGFTTYLENGEVNRWLEDAFASLEGSVLDRVRQVSANNCGAEMKAKVVDLFAIHLVRSPAHKAFLASIRKDFRGSGVQEAASRLRTKMMRDFGRVLSEEESLKLSSTRYAELESDRSMHAEQTRDQRKLIADKLDAFHMQVIEIDPLLEGGFFIGDTPIVHARPATNDYGFHDKLGLLKSTVIFGPLTRRVAVRFVADPTLSALTLSSSEQVDTVNALSVRNALAEVACHPDDLERLRHVCSRLDHLPPSMIF